MINLLPNDLKQDYRFARYNSRLLGWVFGGVIALVGVVVIVGAGLLFMQQSTNHYTKQVASTQQKLQDQKLEETKKQIQDVSSNTKLILQVLSREILFSKLLRQLGATIPENTELQQFQVDKLQGGLTLTAAALDINSATQLQLNLQDPKNKIFEKADIENITCTPGDNTKRLPCVVQIRALFTKNSPYFYITQTKTSGVKQ